MGRVVGNKTRLLFLGSPSCPSLNLAPASDTVADLRLMKQALTDHLITDGIAEHRSIEAADHNEAKRGLTWLYEPDRRISSRVLYYSGHAIMTRAQEIAIAFSDSAESVPTSFVSASMLGQFLANCASSKHLWILDCCFAHGLAFKRLPEVVESMLQHCVFASSSSIGRTVGAGSLSLSPFTESFAYGVRGLAYAPEDTRLGPDRLLEFLEADMSRRYLPKPYLHFSGAATGPLFRSFTPPESVFIPKSRGRLSRPSGQQPFDVFAVALGETGARTRGFAAALGGIDDPAWNLDGRSPAMLDMTKVATGMSPQDESPLVIEDASQPGVWQELLSLRDRRTVVATVQSDEQIPDEIASQVYLAPAPPPSEAEAHRLVRSLAPEGTGDLSLEDLLTAAGGSMHHLKRIAKGAVFLGSPSREGLTSLEITVKRIVDELTRQYPLSQLVLASAAAAPGIHIPHGAILAWLRSNPEADGDRYAPKRTLRMTEKSGLTVPSTNWTLIPSVFSNALREAIPDIDKHFVEFVTNTLSPNYGSRLSPMERFQVVRAAVRYCELHIGDDSFSTYVDQAFVVIGMELFASMKRPVWMPLVDSVESWLGNDASSRALAIFGHAYRLADDYARSRLAFVRSTNRAASRLDHRTAEAGIIRLSVQSGHQIDLRLGEAWLREIPPSNAVETDVDSLALSSVAQLLNQLGNDALRRSDWTAAMQFYDQALGQVRLSDTNSAILMVDILKGKGDVALCIDDRREAARLLGQIWQVIASNLLPKLGRVPFAKALQYAGDVARRYAVPSSENQAMEPRKIAEARYWYERALAEYASQDLDLGVLLTIFKSAELSALAGDPESALSIFLELSDRFRSIGNSAWEFRASAAALKTRRSTSIPKESLVIRECENTVSTLLSHSQLSPYDRMWGELAIQLHSGGIEGDFSKVIQIAKQLGLFTVDSAAQTKSLLPWTYSYSW